ncbi:BREX-2 system adenine-specific DNA-methyltransferase PglX [Actinomadura sp. WMMA1423]|uniref:BREX-2 system adenine-specific DNA-methyltransferase PglX n=1 Tax=Actinomadura sp. WMMA1423 TaxID=2591108 RepID=UPI0011464BDD|nr:BREX-2 system adenine-specific DNA-methyltransferase PglX [Actinomadura sp. WMMA1423]
MIDRAALLADLKKQVAGLEYGLRERATEDTGTRGRLQEEWRRAREARRTAATYESWLDDQTGQTAVAWILGTVFLRFCEDNGLIEMPFLAGPGERLDLAQERQAEYIRQHPHDTDRDWLQAGFAEMSRSPAAAKLFDEAHNPMWQIEISHHDAQSLLAFWRRRGEGGEVVHDFTEPGWDTRLLGDLYEGLSEHAKKTYALLQTPEFVEEFILDHTLEPATDQFGLEGLRLIDPVCGSGHFVLGAFQRVLGRWRKAEPDTDVWELIRRTLLSVHGADKNPFATNIVRFRLLVAAMKAGDISTLADAPRLPLVVATGDSLLHGRGAPEVQDALFDEPLMFPTEDIGEYVRLYDLLGAESYHVVVGNPPYITPKDKVEALTYRRAYRSCTGAFSLAVPFVERFFGLAKKPGKAGEARAAGHVGLLVANAFMKREFGRKLIEEFLPTVDLTHVIDTSGAYIPGHGTPTAVIFGRQRFPHPGGTVLTVIGVRGEPAAPERPGEGRVWQSIRDHVDGADVSDEWTQAVSVPRDEMARFPWNLADPATSDLLRTMGEGGRLADRVLRIGYVASTGADDVFTAPGASWRRAGVETRPLVHVFTGSEVRDWVVTPERQAFLPHAAPEEGNRWAPIGDFPGHFRRLWPYRTVLRNRINFSGQTFEKAGRSWYEWHHLTLDRAAHPWSITFPWVATHPSFAILADEAVMPLNSAPVIRLLGTASEQEVIQLAAVLNSSAVAFWLKQHSHSKGRQGGGPSGTGEPWSAFYEFTSTWLGKLPLPPERAVGARWSAYAEALHATAQELARCLPEAVLQRSGRPARLASAEARDRWAGLRGRMIALQEELDWEVYARYGISPDEEIPLDPEHVPEIDAGERAFEIVLARKMAQGQAGSTWFERHGVQPVLEVPERWSDDYRERILHRIELIENHEAIGFLERPDFKRRWATQGWDALRDKAVREWLLDQLEDRDLWFSEGRAAPRTAEQLTDLLRHRSDIFEAIELCSPGMDPCAVVKELLAEHQLPYVAALYLRSPRGLKKHERWLEVWALQRAEDEQGRRLDIPVPPKYVPQDFLRPGYWRQRGGWNVPNERFIGYPGHQLFGWAGWNHEERAMVLVDLLENGGDPYPLLAGLLELLPWLRQWHGQIDPDYGQSPADAFEAYAADMMRKRGLTEHDVLQWGPPPPKRGRPRKVR